MPVELPFVTLDVFSTERYKGNQLAVVTIPRGTTPKPTQAQKQAIAQEFNLSETVIVHEDHQHGDDDHQQQPGGTTTRHIDIFLVDAEIPFAGHPTIGTAVSLLPKGVDTLVTRAGPITLTQPRPGIVQAGIPHNTHLHANTLSALSPAVIGSPSSGPFSSDSDVRAAELSAPLFSIVRGLNFALVELPSLDHLGRVACLPASFPLDVLDQDWQEGIIGRYYFVRLGKDGDDGRPRIRSRMVLNSFEDAATGSAACALSSYLALHGGDWASKGTDEGTVTFDITQGVEMGRESHIYVEVVTKGGKVEAVGLAGAAVEVMRGTITL